MMPPKAPGSLRDMEGCGGVSLVALESMVKAWRCTRRLVKVDRHQMKKQQVVRGVIFITASLQKFAAGNYGHRLQTFEFQRETLLEDKYTGMRSLSRPCVSPHSTW